MEVAMTTREAIDRLLRERDRRIVEAHKHGVIVEQIALNEGLSAARIWQIIKNGESAKANNNGSSG